MNRQEFRVLSAFGVAVGPEIVPSESAAGTWEIWVEMVVDQFDRLPLECRPGVPERFTSVDAAAATAAAFGHPTAMVCFARPYWRDIVG